MWQVVNIDYPGNRDRDVSYFGILECLKISMIKKTILVSCLTTSKPGIL